jgi:protein-S-isoprenylcysteine O-methyltransferase Ste14
MERVVLVVTIACWGVLASVWVVAWLRGRDRSAVAVTDPRRKRARIAVLAGILIFAVASLSAADSLADPELLAGITLEASWLQPIALAILVPSTAFAIWARLALGASWSVDPRVVGDQRLRTSGPYAVTRHPIYTGILGMLIGTALVIGTAGGLVLVLSSVALFEVKIQREERLLMATFPDEYPGYRQRVPQLIPGLNARHR